MFWITHSKWTDFNYFRCAKSEEIWHRYLRICPLHFKNVIALPCRVHNSFIWSTLYCFRLKLGSFETSRLLCCTETWISGKQHHKNWVTIFYVRPPRPFRNWSIASSTRLSIVLVFSTCLNKQLPQLINVLVWYFLYTLRQFTGFTCKPGLLVGHICQATLMNSVCHGTEAADRRQQFVHHKRVSLVLPTDISCKFDETKDMQYNRVSLPRQRPLRICWKWNAYAKDGWCSIESCTKRAGFWHRSYPRFILQCFLRELGYL